MLGFGRPQHRKFGQLRKDLFPSTEEPQGHRCQLSKLFQRGSYQVCMEEELDNCLQRKLDHFHRSRKYMRKAQSSSRQLPEFGRLSKCT